MNTNVGSTDRLIRFGIAVIALIAAYLVGFGSTAGIVLLVVAVLMGVTGTVRFCPLYRLVGASTCGTTRR
ncbi:MAG: DUF2892 domain-containing protein [Austwickia sp.]|nr:MAG: DUF2892 domain-containing protein [Austwickia sp.]